MNFLEKNLEDIIFNNLDKCVERGFHIYWEEDSVSFRQFRLDPYGIADIVIFHFSPIRQMLDIIIVECKREVIDLNTYHQVKRYVHAMKQYIENSAIGGYPVNIMPVMVGSKIESSGDFLYVYSVDESIQAFTYSYDFDGIQFIEVSRDWIHPSGEAIGKDSIIDRINDHISDQYHLKLYSEQSSDRAHKENILSYGDGSLPLLVTSSGVLLNPNIENGEIKSDLPF